MGINTNHSTDTLTPSTGTLTVAGGVTTSGPATVSSSGVPTVDLNTTTDATQGSISFSYNSLTRWVLNKSNASETGSNAGSDFRIRRYSDAGAFVANAMTINRSTGLTTLESLTVTGACTITQPFDVHSFYPGVPTASAYLYRGKVARAITIPANFAGSYFTATANATASTVFDIQKNGSSIGSVTIGAGGTTPTFATTSGVAQSLAAGDVFAVVAPATPDATLANPAITFAFTR